MAPTVVHTSPERVQQYLDAVYELAMSGGSERVRLAALQELLNRALGKPKEPREITGEIVVRIEGFTPDLAG